MKKDREKKKNELNSIKLRKKKDKNKTHKHIFFCHQENKSVCKIKAKQVMNAVWVGSRRWWRLGNKMIRLKPEPPTTKKMLTYSHHPKRAHFYFTTHYLPLLFDGTSLRLPVEVEIKTRTHIHIGLHAHIYSRTYSEKQASLSFTTHLVP